MAGFVFNIGAEQFLRLSTDWGVGSPPSDIRARLILTASGAPDKDADVMTGIGSVDATATAVVTGVVAPTKSDARDRVEYVADNVLFPTVAAIGACNRMVFFRFVTNDADSVPLVCVEITEVTPNTGDITVTMPANGWFYTQQ
jgi:hypothetical protein